MGLSDFFSKIFKRGEGSEEKVEEKKELRAVRVSTEFSPMRISSMSGESINLIVTLKNLTNDEQLVSVDVILPRNAMLGFERTALKKYAEKKDKLSPGEVKRLVFTIYSTTQTKPNSYPVELRVFRHYQTYEKVLAQLTKTLTLRVI